MLDKVLSFIVNSLVSIGTMLIVFGILAFVTVSVFVALMDIADEHVHPMRHPVEQVK